MRVIGIDPGTMVVGYGVIESDGTRAALIACGAVRAPKNAPEPERLAVIFEGLEAAIAEHTPDVACVEDVFAGKDVRAALKIGEGRGVALLALARAGLEIHSLPPATIKKALTGNGRADKSQVQRMVQVMLSLDEPPQPHDAADALAAALCLAHRIT